MFPMVVKLFLIAILCLAFLTANAEPGKQVRLAVAANFSAPMKELGRRFSEKTGYRTMLSFGSTGKLYAQIRNGAKFDVFLAADQKRPRLLHEAGLGQSPRTYAIGRLVLWSNAPDLITGSDALASAKVRRIAIANPKTAPYGRGAMQILEALGQAQALRAKLVRGENIAQTYQFVATGNAQLGFVAASQVKGIGMGSHWQPPQSMYDPIRQDAQLLQRGANNPAALAFLDFLFSEESCQRVKEYGYACGDAAPPGLPLAEK